MHLHRIHLNPRCKEARRDLADPYQMHATLCRAFYSSDTPCPAGSLLWRLEPETDREGRPRVLILSRETPDWSRILAPGWLAENEPGKKLALGAIKIGQAFRFRLRANPCKTVKGKRLGLMQLEQQRAWLARKGEQHGFTLPDSGTPDYFEFQTGLRSQAYPDIQVSHEEMLSGRQNGGNTIRVYAALFEGRLMVRDLERFRTALEAGIGHGKAMGLGLLSVVPIAS